MKWLRKILGIDKEIEVLKNDIKNLKIVCGQLIEKVEVLEEESEAFVLELDEGFFEEEEEEGEFLEMPSLFKGDKYDKN